MSLKSTTIAAAYYNISAWEEAYAEKELTEKNQLVERAVSLAAAD